MQVNEYLNKLFFIVLKCTQIFVMYYKRFFHKVYIEKLKYSTAEDMIQIKTEDESFYISTRLESC